MLWAVATVIAAAAQTARNAMQSALTASLGTLGATQVRFLYGLPFACCFLALIAVATHRAIPAPDLRFFAFAATASVAQIGATALLLAAMRLRSFSIAVALSKTDAVQAAAFGLAVLHDLLTPWRLAAIGIATAGVVLAAGVERFDRASVLPALFGIASGGAFAIAAVFFRGAILSLADGDFLMRATTTLVWSLAIQSALLGAWLWAFRRPALLKSFTLWRQSIFAGFMGALASLFWFIGFSLTSAANVRALGLVEIVFAQIVSRRVFSERASPRELAGIALILVGAALLVFHP